MGLNRKARQFFIVGDTGAKPAVILQDATGAKIDLTNKAVHFTMVDRNGTNKVNPRTAAPDGDQVLNKGLVEYVWVDADVNTAGLFFGYWIREVTIEEQRIVVSGTPTSGTYTITYTDASGAQITAALAFDANSVAVQAALRLLTGLDSIAVAESGVTPNFTHTITYTGVPGNLQQITVTELTDTGVFTISTPTRGVAVTHPGDAQAFEILFSDRN